MIVLGFLALITPFSPGSWLLLIGLEILGLRILLEDRLLPFLKGRYKKACEDLIGTETVKHNQGRRIKMGLSVMELAERIDAELVGNGSGNITAVGSILSSRESEVTFVSDERHVPKIKNSKAGAVIVCKHIEGLAKPQLIVKDVNAALIETLKIFAPKLKAPPGGIDPTAKVGQDVKITAGVSVGPGVLIEDGVEIGENTVIASGCKIGQNSKIGKNCRLDYNMVIYHNCIIGNNVVIQANTVIGSTGFGYAFISGAHTLIPHIGRVVIEDFVEIGANVCIDRAKFGETRIGTGTKIDNLVQIAHNVTIGKCCLIAGCVGIAGSCKIGDGVVLGGQVGVIDNIEIGDGTVVGARSMVIHNVPEKQKLFGVPATNRNEALEIIALTRRLPRLFEQLKQQNERIEKLEMKTSCVTPISYSSILRPKLGRKIGWVTGIAAAMIMGILIFSHMKKTMIDPHEHKVEHIVKEYQDGNDDFYVSSGPYLEDLRTGKHLFVIADLPRAIETIVSKRDKFKDCFFLISYKDLEKVKSTQVWTQLSFVTEVYIVGEKFALLSTERGRT